MSTARGQGSASTDAGTTPMMAQYWSIKRQNPDCLLFFRMGDFYELFFDDAVAAARALDIALTKRGKHQGQDIPMCGVPVHSHEGYLARLVREGFRVAVCEQTESPAEARKRSGKSLVAREVTRVVTAGTLTEDTLLDARAHSFLVACAEAGGELGLAWIDLSTGDFQTQPAAPSDLDAALARLDPREVLIADPLIQDARLFETLAGWKQRLTPLPVSRFDGTNARRRLRELFGVEALDAFGSFSTAEVAAAGALVDYIDLTQKGRRPRLERPRRLARGAALEIDAATRRNLELSQTLAGERRGSLLATIDRTVTGAGARLLAARLAAPLTDPAAIDGRLDAVQYFAGATDIRLGLRDRLRRCPDIERALSRLGLGRGGPRDLAAIRDGLATAADVRDRLDSAGSAGAPTAIAGTRADLGHHPVLIDRLNRAIAAEPPVLARDGGFIATGYAPELDEIRALRDESRRLIADLQSRYTSETKVSVLKIRHNNVLGYYVEVPARHAERMPVETFVHRQTMAGAVRYTTVELGDLAGRIASAAEHALAMELSLFDNLVGEVTGRADEIAKTARALAQLDVAAALADVAVDALWTRPALNDGTDLLIRGGRHPVVEAALTGGDGGAFVANDCALGDGSRLWLLTGPNMAGKSTFLRQNALIVVLAQMGAFVPAEEARIGIVDRLFSRVGAADDLARGRSTFMVEMVETAAILHQAGPRSLVILDEIGRGTATYDGLSIAWAVVEHLHDVNRCRALFATHYRELTALATKLDDLACHTMRVKEWQGQVVFLHEVASGAADRAYGIHVGRLAGLPEVVVSRAESILATLESGEQGSAVTRLAEDLPLFAATRPMSTTDRSPTQPSEVDEILTATDPNALTPRQALELIYQLKEKI